MEAELEREVTELIAEIVEIDEKELWAHRQDHFVEKLGIDSMMALEILASLEKKYRIEIPEEEILELVTLQSSIDCVRQKLAKKAP